MTRVRANNARRGWTKLLLVPWFLAPACVLITNADRYEIGDDGSGGVGGTAMGGAGGTGTEGGAAGAGGEVATFPTTTIHFDNQDLTQGAWKTHITTTDSSREGLERQSYPNDPWWPADTELEIRNRCNIRLHEVTSNPAELWLYGLDDTLLWPGALLRGQPYSEGTLEALEIPSADRTPLGLTVSHVAGQAGRQVTRVLREPSRQAYDELLGEILEAQFEDQLTSLGEIEIRVHESKRPARLWQEQGLSTRFSSIDEALADALDPDSMDRTLIIQLVQNLFDVTIHGPPLAEAWVTEDYLGGGLQRDLDSAVISDKSPPVYVSHVSYGRMLTLAISSSILRGPDLIALVNASIRALKSGEKPERNNVLDAARDASNVATAPLGGDRKVVGALEQSWDWASFFLDDARLSNAVPIRAELHNLADSSPAGLTEQETYEEKICFPTLVEDGPFDFGFGDTHARPSDMGSINVAAKGDFNGDGIDDVVWNHLSGNENSVYLGYAGGSFLNIVEPGDLCAGERCDFSDLGVPWGRYQLLTGDFDGNGLDDLLWTPKPDALDEFGYELYLLRATNQGFERAPIKQRLAEEEPPEAYRTPLVKDLDDNGAMDLVYSFVRRDGDKTIQEYQILLATTASDATPFTAMPLELGPENTDLSYPSTELTFDAVDINGDGRLDLLWGLLGRQPSADEASDELNVTHFKLDLPDEDSLSFGEIGLFTHSSHGGWSYYQAFYGDFDGDSDADAAYIRLADSALPAAVHWARSQGVVTNSDPQFLSGQGQTWADAGDAVLYGRQRHLSTLDLNGDEARDIVASSYSGADGYPAQNAIRVLLGGSDDPAFDETVTPQTHPIEQDWDNFETWLVGDFDGDGRDDLLWNDADEENRVFIAYGKEVLAP